LIIVRLWWAARSIDSARKLEVKDGGIVRTMPAVRSKEKLRKL
jgi:hypothetical protein